MARLVLHGATVAHLQRRRSLVYGIAEIAAPSVAAARRAPIPELSDEGERRGTSPQVSRAEKHMGWEDAKDDYVILDGEKSVGRIYREHDGRWLWSVNTSPYPAPPPNNGLAKSLEEAK